MTPLEMPVKVTAPSLQQRKQTLVRAELARVAWDLFAARGYEATTVQTIARAAGVSRRTFFRYYSSKEDVLVETSDALADELLAEVAARPAGEAPLESIRRALVPVLERRLATPELARGIMRLLRESRALRRAMLERHARLEERLAAHFARPLRVDPARDSTPALVAFLARALLDTAFNVWYDQGRHDVAALVDELFATLAAVARPGPRAGPVRPAPAARSTGAARRRPAARRH
ncbi:MAG: TetR family transcriptional regulator [Betaproteobacteria bacterium]